MTARNLHQEITARILSLLEAGTIPWKQPWKNYATGGGAMPRNAITGRAYSGANTVLLWATGLERGYTDARYMTFKQAKEAGASVRKGEKSTQVVYASSVEKMDEKTGEAKRISFLKAFHVFNVAQIDGLPEKIMQPAPPRVINAGERDDVAEAFMASTGADIRHGEARAYYATSGDFINLPIFESFNSAPAYYATAFHELTHWTGNASRLDRKFGKRFGDASYAAEELVAELGSAFICAEFGIDNETIHDSAAYLETWKKALAKDDRLFVAAASGASKAVEFMRSLALSSEEKMAA